MAMVCGSGAGLHALEAVLKVESLVVEAALLAQGSLPLLLLLMGLQHSSDSDPAIAIVDQRTNKRNADVDINNAELKDAEETGDIEEDSEEGSDDEDDGGDSEGEDSEDMAEDDEQDDSDVNSNEGSDDEDDDDDEDEDDDDDEDDDEDGYNDEDEEEDQPPQKRKK